MKIRTKRASVNIEVDGVIFTVDQALQAEANAAAAKHTSSDESGNERTDVDKVGCTLFTRRVLSWEGELTDEDGNQLACNDANKSFIWTFDNEFAGKIMTLANKAIRKREDLAAKN